MQPELLETSRNNKLPYHSEAIEYYQNTVNNKFICSWLGLDDVNVNEKSFGYGRNTTEDAYAEAFNNEIRDLSIGQQQTLPSFKGAKSIVQLVMTQAIFMVSCSHEVLGTIIDYTIDPEFIAVCICEDDANDSPSVEADVQTFIQFLMVTAFFHSFFEEGANVNGTLQELLWSL